jgi:Zn-dependent peptidase ImmA (M78 family)
MELGAYPGESLFRILEEVYAVKIFYLHLGNDTSSASYYAEELGAAIMLNSDSKQWRRNYDLAHELFHLVIWKVRNPDADTSSLELEEKFADFFASNLLIPEQALHSAVVSVMSSDNKITYDDLDKIARQFNVSLDALCWRLCYVYKIPSKEIKDIIDKAKTNSNLLIRESEKPQTFPPRYIALAVNALKHGEISSKQFANYLDISISEAYSYNIQEDFDGILQIKTDPL